MGTAYHWVCRTWASAWLRPERAPGEITTVTFTGSTPSGIHIVLVVVDGFSPIPESEERNNEFTYAFRN